MTRTKLRSKLLSSSKDSPAKRFRHAFERITIFDGVPGWSESNTFSNRVADVIADLANATIDPKEGIEPLLNKCIS
jgi:hypothetical protein